MLSNTDISHYHILSKLGAGGMGEVYLAEDMSLHRKVALKVLPAEVAANQERMRRFHQEATSAAALNHPNIAHIYEIGEHDGTNFIAMEFIDGVTLREKIHHEPTELRKLLRYLQHAAEGLAKAHAAGIIHRDLKPDNIMVTHEGHAKILDFGLAKLIEPTAEPTGQKLELHGGLSEVATAIIQQHSTPGMILGTAGYMSPEQAQGRTNQVDHRSDIFSFGCILYEALTRRKAFAGKDAIDSLNKIIREPLVPIRDLNPSAPADLQRIVRRCVAKDPEERYQTIKDVAIELKEVRRELQATEQTTATLSPVISTAGTSQSLNESAIMSADSISTRASSAEYIVSEIKRHRKGLILALAITVIVIAGASFALYKLSNRSRVGPPVSFATAKIIRLTTSGKVTNAAISPDGKYVAHVVDDGGQQSLWMRQVATQSNVEIVQRSEDRFIRLAFSPDGNYIYYSVREKGSGSPFVVLYQVPSLGGAARKVLTDIFGPVSFSPDGKRFAYLSRSTNERETFLIIANADGSGARKLPGQRGNERLSAPSWSPDGKTIVSVARNIPENYTTVVAVSAESGEIKSFTSQKWGFVGGVAWLADGGSLLVTAQEPGPSQHSQIWEISYPEGAAQQITNDLNGYRSISLDANSDALVTVQAEQVANIWVMPANDTAHATRLTVGKRDDNDLSWTPDGAVVYASNASGNRELYLIDVHGGAARQLTANSSHNDLPSVSPDGRYIAFNSGMGGVVPHIWRIDIDGLNPQQLTNKWDIAPQWSPDSQWIVYLSQSNNGVTIWKVAVNGGQPVQLTENTALLPTVSPDGKQVACYYQDKPNAPPKLAVLPIEGGQPTKIFVVQISNDKLSDLRWTADGRGIVYVITRGGVSNLWAQPLDGGQLKQLTNFTSDLIFSFDLSRDGKQLALSRGSVTSDVVLISNFR